MKNLLKNQVKRKTNPNIIDKNIKNGIWHFSHLSHVGIAFLGNKKANKMLRFISKFYNYYL